jgi:hypothetical protein
LEGERESDNPGMFYVPNPAFQPGVADQHVEDFITDIKITVKSLFSQENGIVASLPGNMTKAQTVALKALKENNDIIIKPADKNLGLCIVDREWYIKECSGILACSDTYQQILEEPKTFGA